MKYRNFGSAASVSAIATTALVLLVQPAWSDMLPGTDHSPAGAKRHNNQGIMLGVRGQWTKAIEEHEQAVAIEPANKNYRTNLSSAYLQYGDVLLKKQLYDTAAYCFQKSLKADAANKPAKASLKKTLKLIAESKQKAR